jgi:carboxyl-terminal processing protease
MSKLLSYMLNKRNLPIVLLVSALGIVIALKTFAFTGNPPTKYERILKNVSELLEEIHYSPKNIDDQFSKEVFKKYLGDVDVEKKIFLKSDIQELSKYQNQLDDEILGKVPVQFVPAIVVLYKKRLQETQNISHEILAQPFDFSKQETVNLDYEKLDFPLNATAQREEIRKKLKYLTLEKYVDLLDQQETAKIKPAYVAKNNEQLEKEAREKILKISDRFYDHLRIKANDDNFFNLFVETIVQCMDPHTDYFPPIEKRSFDEDMSGRFY